MAEKINIVSLGCARNLVDSEVMAGILRRSDYEVVPETAGADIVLVNTCSFIDAAKEESVDTILEIARLKKEGSLKTLVVAGCLPQRYAGELARELPEVDLFIGTGEVPNIAGILKERRQKRVFVGLPSYLYDHETPRIRSTASHTAFVKASEGCDHKCAFCIIPQLRGPHRSRPIASIVSEAEALARDGVKEINLIAQDLTAYGRERRDGTTLYGLLKELDRVDGIEWVRLLYAYPNFLDDALLDFIRDGRRICKYVDIPLQHASRHMLMKMRRGKSGSAVRDAVAKLRARIPGVTLRTSLIVGFPGETDDDFRELLDFVEESEFDRLGVFKYSVEEGTAAAAMDGGVPEAVKEARWQEVMDLQADISRKKNQALIGVVQRVMIDNLASDGGMPQGRTQGHAPEVDGAVYIAGEPRGVRAGDFVEVKITEASDYDLTGEIING
ncbi:MAG TPA: 30S ribosomal protein S12 methylthiotransferase RimO [Candidatus Binatia bacterium]